MPETIVNSVSESTRHNRDYNDEVCIDIQRRIESKLAEQNYTIAEKAEFVIYILFYLIISSYNAHMTFYGIN